MGTRGRGRRVEEVDQRLSGPDAHCLDVIRHRHLYERAVGAAPVAAGVGAVAHDVAQGTGQAHDEHHEHRQDVTAYAHGWSGGSGRGGGGGTGCGGRICASHRK